VIGESRDQTELGGVAAFDPVQDALVGVDEQRLLDGAAAVGLDLHESRAVDACRQTDREGPDDGEAEQGH